MLDAAVVAPAPSRSAGSQIVAAGVSIVPLGPVDRLQVNVARPSAGAVAELEARLDLTLPRSPLWTEAGGVSVFALGPRAWLLEAETLDPIRARLDTGVRDLGANAAEIGDAFEAFRLIGERAGALLSTGCAIDLHPSAFSPGACARTLLARLDIVLSATATGYEVRVERSYTRHLWAWFETAAVEFRS